VDRGLERGPRRKKRVARSASERRRAAMFQDDEVAQPDPEQANTARIAALGDDEFWAELFNAVCVR
jgi:hypothetical protein